MNKMNVNENLIKMPLVYEPLRKNRFLLRFPSDLGIQEWWVSKTSCPKVDVKKTWFGTKINKWSEVIVILRNTIGPSVAQAVMSWLEKPIEYDCELEMLDPEGVVVQKWVLEKCKPIAVDFGDLDYQQKNIIEITVRIQPKKCVLHY